MAALRSGAVADVQDELGAVAGGERAGGDAKVDGGGYAREPDEDAHGAQAGEGQRVHVEQGEDGETVGEERIQIAKHTDNNQAIGHVLNGPYVVSGVIVCCG